MTNFIKILFVFSIFCISFKSMAADLSDPQVANLKKAYSFGKANKPPVFKGSSKDFGYVMAAIMWQESSAGINCGTGKNYIGPYQNSVTTVKSRLKQSGINKSREQVIKELKTPAGSNYWTKVELDSWLSTHDGNIKKALASYNAGWNHQKGLKYSTSILKKVEYLKSNNIL